MVSYMKILLVSNKLFWLWNVYKKLLITSPATSKASLLSLVFVYPSSAVTSCSLVLRTPKQIFKVLINGAIFNRITVINLSLLLKMKYHLMNIVSPWRRMALGLDIWNYKQLLLLLILIYAFTEYVFSPHLIPLILLGSSWFFRTARSLNIKVAHFMLWPDVQGILDWLTFYVQCGTAYVTSLVHTEFWQPWFSDASSVSVERIWDFSFTCLCIYWSRYCYSS